MTDKHIPASKLLALLEYYDAEMQCLTVRSDDLRAIIDEAPEVENQDIGGKAVIKNHPEGWEYGEEPAGDPYTGEPVAVLALKNTELSKRVSVLEDLLSSAYNIANREGKDTHWFRFAAQLHVNGISPVTAKTFKILPSDNDKPPSTDLTKLVGELVEALPMQPIVIAKDGAVRFKENRIVSAVLEHASKAGYSLNEIACGDFTDEEHMQFAQLIGYSVSGYGNLSYASEQSVTKADEIAEALRTRAKEYLK